MATAIADTRPFSHSITVLAGHFKEQSVTKKMNDESSPEDRRSGHGVRQRIVQAATELFTAQGINATGIEKLAGAAKVSKRTLYTHFGSKDNLVYSYLSLKAKQLPGGPTEPDNSWDPREQLLAIFESAQAQTGELVRGCPFLNAAVEVPDPRHPVRRLAAAHKIEFADKLASLAREAGAHAPEELGKQLALLYDGAAARGLALNDAAASKTARAIAAKLIEAATETP
ncbi:TetR/AcrR family transcriptional regulator [Streptomyces sp. NPDC057062]|uniref:TetR/AcrR family transcriptional regulator n=1 Tax=Streptomyces sp. NPDC057062 TaxID=3346011 RepID=UPI0036433D90